MHPRKVLILSILISFTCHTVVLSLTSFIDMSEKKDKGKVITVNLNDAEKNQEKSFNSEKKIVRPTRPKIENASAEKIFPEDTVDLSNEKPQYSPYLKKIKQKIDNIWKYPRKAYEIGQEGIAIVKFSIDKNGSVIASSISKSSGAKLLDQEVIEAVQSAAPYEPLPTDMNLSRLHIIATFHYKLSE